MQSDTLTRSSLDRSAGSIRLSSPLKQRAHRWTSFALGPGAPFIVFFAIAASYASLYFWECDDAFISFRYARNLANGEGLVFNVGERLEGYTNFLWVIELAVLNWLFALPIPETAVALSVACSIGVFAVTVLFARTTPIVALRYLVTLLAVGLLAINQHVAIWTTSGLETRQFTLCVLLGAFLAYRARGRSRWLGLASVAFASAALTRPEGPLIEAGIVAWYVFDSRVHKRFSWRGLLALTLPFASVLLGHYLFRYAYYGEWLPNTYYAKHVRAWPDAGVQYFTAITCDSALYLTLPLAALGAFYRWHHGRDSLHVLAALLIGPHAAYLTNIGGDHFYFRPLDFYWPFLAIATADGIALLVFLARLSARRRGLLWARPGSVVLGLGVGLVVGVYASVLQIADYLLSYQETELEGHVNPTVTPQNFPLAYLLPFMGRVTPAYNDAMRFLTSHAIAVRWKEHELFLEQQQRDFGPYGTELRRRLPKDAIMPYPFAGIMPYQFPELTVIDTLGLVDKTVARHGSPRNSDRNMAHDRRPPPGYLESRRVTLEIGRATASFEEALMRTEYAALVAPGLWMSFDVFVPGWAERAFHDVPLYQRPKLFPGAERVAESRALLANRKLRGVKLISDFEQDAAGWLLEEKMSLQREEMPNREPVDGQIGEGRLSSHHIDPRDKERLGTRATGQATLTPFLAAPGDALAFLLAGGTKEGSGVELRVNGRAVKIFHGTWSDAPEYFALVLCDLSPYSGRPVSLHVFDNAEDDFVMVDHVILLRPE